ncbi:hypothetical protein [Neorhizobium sp. JUb45]|uniref:hypothetical protein n=1 Tax=Neorhizobium sp. JUb45 TaxID=2485113 RepID=UPI0010516D1C|nr:hypothetical protein [Neorhizobium sp. JUb45]TCR07230.1 hypothetical protein EDF70_1011201 [Neorhizobium sp. JUb45]
MAIFKSDSLDGILNTFNKTITRLDAFSAKRQQDADAAATLIKQKQDEQKAALDDVTKSAAVRSKISDLIAA